MFRNKAFRWILLLLGVAAIIALTGMNVYSLYDIRDKMTDGEEKRQIALVDDLVSDIRNEVYKPFRGLNRLELEPVEQSIANFGRFPSQVQEKINAASKNPIFDGIYYTPDGIDPCVAGSEIYSYSYSEESLELTDTYPPAVCDGVGIIRTKTRIELNSGQYRWNNIVEFDAHRSMNIGLLNLKEKRLIGYLTATIDQEYVVNDLIAPKMEEFSDNTQGTVIWLISWANRQVLATSMPQIDFDVDIDGYSQRFGSSMFDNWVVRIGFLDNPVASFYNNTLYKNLIVLGVAVLFLLGALIFMFYTAQKERALSQRQAGFLANVTHELKTPLAVMQAAGENISDGRVTEPERLKQYGNHIFNESIRLKQMIEKLLDVARTDSGQTLIQSAPHNLNTIVRDFLTTNREYIEAKGFNVSFNTTDSESMIMIDPDTIETILSNLTENAVKYSTDTKEVRYSVSADANDVILKISDKGIGIDKKHLRNIFKKFYRVEDSLNAKTKGHGLGLSIVKSLVEMNGGRIEVSSEIEKGTTFSLRFPIFVNEEKTLNLEKNRITSTKTFTDPAEHA